MYRWARTTAAGSNVGGVFFLADGAGGDAAGTHDAFDVVIELGAFFEGLQVFFVRLLLRARAIPVAG